MSPQNTFGVSGVNSVAAKSKTIEEISELSSDIKEKQKESITSLHTALVVSYKCPEAPIFKFDSKQGNLHRAFRLYTPWK